MSNAKVQRSVATGHHWTLSRTGNTGATVTAPGRVRTTGGSTSNDKPVVYRTDTRSSQPYRDGSQSSTHVQVAYLETNPCSAAQMPPRGPLHVGEDPYLALTKVPESTTLFPCCDSCPRSSSVLSSQALPGIAVMTPRRIEAPADITRFDQPPKCCTVTATARE
ncbi:hypothetical protein M8818_000661 [Zalaria obscura]|uniref:Uncharacterized protein n=1 Tax=Zalaria obscura TaxID=2024903 RepID=A0ACC3SMJ8_9PEZI